MSSIELPPTKREAKKRTFRPQNITQANIGAYNSPNINTSAPCAMYPRISTPGQRGNVSSEMQTKEDGELWALAQRYGWSNDLIRIYPDDMEISGTVKMAERPAFRRLLTDIINGEVKTIIAIQVDRLFRDKYGADYGQFIEICDKHKVLVITPDMVYDFSNSQSITMFRLRCQAAWDYLEYQVHQRMHGARRFLGYSGRWAGGGVPVGYIVNRDKNDPNYRKLMIYKPHADILYHRIFKRYYELNQQLNKLWRELNEDLYTFPALPGHITSKLMLKKVLDIHGEIIGYKISSVRGLQQIMTNPVYIGWWIYCNKIVSPQNHEPIIPVEEQDAIFWPIFKYRSLYNVDGTINEHCKSRPPAKYFQTDDLVSILKPVLESGYAGYRVYIHRRRAGAVNRMVKKPGYLYAFYKIDEQFHGAKYMLDTKAVDQIYWQALLQKLDKADDIELLDELEGDEKTENKEMQLRRLDELIDGSDKAVKRLQKDLVRYVKAKATTVIADGEEDNDEDDVLLTFNTQIAEQKRAKKNLEEQKTLLLSTPEQLPIKAQMIEYRDMLLNLRDKVDEFATQDEQREIVKIFTKRVYLINLSPRVYQMIINWRDESWGSTIVIAKRDGNPSIIWSQEENAILKELYPRATINEIMEALPERSLGGIRTQARRFKLLRIKRDCQTTHFDGWIIEDLKDHSWKDLKLVKTYQLMDGPCFIEISDNNFFCPNDLNKDGTLTEIGPEEHLNQMVQLAEHHGWGIHGDA